MIPNNSKVREKRRRYNRDFTAGIREQQRNGVFTSRQVEAFYTYLTYLREGIREGVETYCIEWNGAHTHRKVDDGSVNRPVFQTLLAAKAAWLIHQLEFDGQPTSWPIDEDGQALDCAHLCRNRYCVNWEHIMPMTMEEHDAYDGRAKSDLTPPMADELPVPL